MAPTDCTRDCPRPCPYSVESLAAQLRVIDLPFASVFARCLVALLTCGKATVHQVSVVLPGSRADSPVVSTEAKRQEIRRLLDQPVLAGNGWAKVIAALLPKGPWVLALDRTEYFHTPVKWKVGKKAVVNILTLAVVCYGCAVPILWLPLDKPGCSDTAERIALIARFLSLFGTKSIRFLTADREFIGSDWIYYLLCHKVPFRIRIKASEFLESQDGQEKRASEWFDVRACRCKPQPMWLWGLQIFVGGTRLDAKHRSDYLIVISNEKGNLLEDYRLRWKIETLFQALKGRGFEMEQSHLTMDTRLFAWFGFLSLALAWCLSVGHFLQSTEPGKNKKHGRSAHSIFHRGMTHLQALLAPLAGTPNQTAFNQAIGLFATVNGT